MNINIILDAIGVVYDWYQVNVPKLVRFILHPVLMFAVVLFILSLVPFYLVHKLINTWKEFK